MNRMLFLGVLFLYMVYGIIGIRASAVTSLLIRSHSASILSVALQRAGKKDFHYQKVGILEYKSFVLKGLNKGDKVILDTVCAVIFYPKAELRFYRVVDDTKPSLGRVAVMGPECKVKILNITRGKLVYDHYKRK